MATNNDTNDISFLDENSNTSLKIKDTLYLIFRNLHWLILFAVIGAFAGTYYARTQEKIFASNARIIIKDPNSNSVDMRDSELLNSVTNARTGKFYVSTLNNELMIMTSKTTMMEVVKAMDLNVTYTMPTKLVKRVKDLYGETPVLVAMLDVKDSQHTAMTVTPADAKRAVLQMEEFGPAYVALNDTVTTPVGRVVVSPTWNYTESWYGAAVTVTHATVSGTADYYRAVVSAVRDDDKNTIVNLTVRDKSAQRAADLLNKLIEVYNEDAINSKKKIVAYSHDYINERLAVLDEELGAKEMELASFKRQNELIDVGSLGQTYVSASIASSQQAEKLEQQLSLARYLQEAVNNGSLSKPLPVSLGIEDPNIVASLTQFNESALKLDKYETSGATNNPIVRELMTEQTVLKSNLSKMVSVYISSLSERLQGARSAGARASSQVQSVPTKQIYVENVERMQKIKESLYLNLLTKREELMISQPSMEGNAKVVEEARVIPVPVAPNERSMMLKGLLIGLCIPIAFYLIRKLLDTKVRYRADIEKGTTVPFVGEVPAREKDDTRKIVVYSNKRDAISEAFRMLRPNIEYMFDNTQPSHVILFTSFFESSGKTFLTSNLTASFAIAGKKAVLVDLDLRKGTLNKNTTETRMAGVSNYLAGQVDDIDEIIQHGVLAENVDCVFSGPIPPNPAELLSGTRFDEMISQLRERYTYIILDSVPAGLVADADIVKRVADATMFVIRYGRFDKQMLGELEKLYKAEKFPNMGIVLNAVQYKKRGYGYGYGKNYGYGYGYGNYGYGGYGYGSYGYGYGYGANYGVEDSGKKGKKKDKKKSEEQEA